MKSMTSSTPQLHRLAAAVAVFALSLAAAVTPVAALEPRALAGPPELYQLPPEAPVVRVVVKFHEGTGVRQRNGSLTTLAPSERDLGRLTALGLDPDEVAADLLMVESLVGSDPSVTRFDRMFRRAERLLDADRLEGEALSGAELADLNLYYEALVDEGTRFAQVEGLLDRLNELDSVEIAYGEGPSEPAQAGSNLAPTSNLTPSFQGQQGYLNAAPAGIDALYAWTKNGGRGNGVKIVDVEWAWRTTHEDLPVLFHTGGVQSSSLSFRNHGTAVLGEMVAKNNGIGVTGIVHNAQAGYESVQAQSAASAIANASAAVGSGGIVLIEIHRLGPANSSPCTCNLGQCDFIAIEYWQADYDAIRNAVLANRTVVEAAGNGSSNLNDPQYGGLFFRTVRDSGAILVGARQSVGGLGTCWTNHGYRVDVHAWGENVVTTGYGNLYNGGSEDSWYTNSFSGTSSASPIVVGAAGSLQGIAKTSLFKTLSSSELRSRVWSNGTWNWADPKFIGPQPNLRGAADQLLNGNRLPVANTDFLSTPKNTRLPIYYNVLTGNDTDADGDALWLMWYDFVTVKGGTSDCCHGGGFNYDPPVGFTGTDSLTYRIQDARGLEAIGKVFITVF